MLRRANVGVHFCEYTEQTKLTVTQKATRSPRLGREFDSVANVN